MYVYIQYMDKYENVHDLGDWIQKSSSFSIYFIIKAEWRLMFKMLLTHKSLSISAPPLPSS